MVDVETDGLSPTQNSMTSLCVVQFDPDTGDVMDKLHQRFLNPLTGRYADQETLNWRRKNNVDMEEKKLQSRNATRLMTELHQFLTSLCGEKRPVLFANHTEFDIAFIKGYYEAVEMSVPWDYNKVFELNSILMGRGIHDKGELIKNLLESRRWHEIKALHFDGKACKHDAFFDCVYQNEILMLGLKQGNL